MRKRWLVVAMTLVVLTAGLVGGGAALADDADTADGSIFGSLASRVAAILGLDESEVQDAITQAQAELRDEAMQSKMDALVEAGEITQEQADEYLEWQASRPDSIPGFGGRGFGHGGHGFGRGHGRGHGRFGGFGGFGGFHCMPEAPVEEAAPSAEGTVY